jgi:hypothetical protein
MNRQQVNTLLEILAGLEIGDNTVEHPLNTAMKEFYAALINNREGKSLPTVQREFDKKVDLLSWKLGQAFRNAHKKELAKITEKQTAPPLKNEKEYSIAKAAKDLKMTPQNLNKHLEKHSEIKVITISPRKRYITETELNKLKQKLRITS